MRRADRLFDIIQLLRTATRPVTAAEMAERLEVTARTVYRDVATLQARRVPIEGAAGLGYVLRQGFDLPPLMFTIEEIEAIAVGARMLCRTGDRGLQAASESVLSKVTVGLPEALRTHLAMPPFFVADIGAPPPPTAEMSVIRAAIRDERKLRIAYRDEKGAQTDRTIWPVAVAYCTAATLLSAWCELRGDFRHFRVDRILQLDRLDEAMPVPGKALFLEWMARIRFERPPDDNATAPAQQAENKHPAAAAAAPPPILRTPHRRRTRG